MPVSKKEYCNKLIDHLWDKLNKAKLSPAQLAGKVAKNRQSVERVFNRESKPSAYYIYELSEGLKKHQKHMYNFNPSAKPKK